MNDVGSVIQLHSPAAKFNFAADRIQDLVDREVETKQVDFKYDLLEEEKVKDKDEFCKDVSALANTIQVKKDDTNSFDENGYLVLGIADVPSKPPPPHVKRFEVPSNVRKFVEHINQILVENTDPKVEVSFFQHTFVVLGKEQLCGVIVVRPLQAVPVFIAKGKYESRAFLRWGDESPITRYCNRHELATLFDQAAKRHPVIRLINERANIRIHGLKSVAKLQWRDSQRPFVAGLVRALFWDPIHEVRLHALKTVTALPTRESVNDLITICNVEHLPTPAGGLTVDERFDMAEQALEALGECADRDDVPLIEDAIATFTSMWQLFLSQTEESIEDAERTFEYRMRRLEEACDLSIQRVRARFPLKQVEAHNEDGA